MTPLKLFFVTWEKGLKVCQLTGLITIKVIPRKIADGQHAVSKGTTKKRNQDAQVNIIEVGWLKDKPHKEGSSFYHVPADIEPYILNKNPNSLYVAMIDWDRYDDSALPVYDGKTIDAIRVVFPLGKHKGCKNGYRRTSRVTSRSARRVPGAGGRLLGHQ